MQRSPEHELVAKAGASVDLERRIIYLMGEINSDVVYRVTLALHALDKVPTEDPGDIVIILNSEGGLEQDGYAIYDAITMCRSRVIIEGYGSVMSISAAIFQAGDIRRLAPHAAFMIHNGGVTGTTDGESIRQDAIVDLAAQIKKDNQKYYEILAGPSKQTIGAIEEWCRQETYFTAEEAVKAGFADEIIKPLKKLLPPRKRRRKNNKRGE